MLDSAHLAQQGKWRWRRRRRWQIAVALLRRGLVRQALDKGRDAPDAGGRRPTTRQRGVFRARHGGAHEPSDLLARWGCEACRHTGCLSRHVGEGLRPAANEEGVARKSQHAAASTLAAGQGRRRRRQRWLRRRWRWRIVAVRVVGYPAPTRSQIATLAQSLSHCIVGHQKRGSTPQSEPRSERESWLPWPHRNVQRVSPAQFAAIATVTSRTLLRFLQFAPQVASVIWTGERPGERESAADARSDS